VELFFKHAHKNSHVTSEYAKKVKVRFTLKQAMKGQRGVEV
jgi:hypothetical protein